MRKLYAERLGDSNAEMKYYSKAHILICAYTRKMDYYEAGNFVQTRATNKQSLTEYPKISVDVYYSNGGYLDGASEYKTLSTKGSIGIKGCSNYRSSGGDNYKHTVTVYRDSSHTNKVATISKTVG